MRGRNRRIGDVAAAAAGRTNYLFVFTVIGVVMILLLALCFSLLFVYTSNTVPITTTVATTTTAAATTTTTTTTIPPTTTTTTTVPPTTTTTTVPPTTTTTTTIPSTTTVPPTTTTTTTVPATTTTTKITTTGTTVATTTPTPAFHPRISNIYQDGFSPWRIGMDISTSTATSTIYCGATFIWFLSSPSVFQYCDQQSTPEGPLLTLATLQGPSHLGIVTFTSDTLPNNLATFPSTAVFNFAYYTTTVPDIDFFVAGAFACYQNPQPAGVTTFYSYSEKEPYQNFLTCLNVAPTLSEFSGVLNCEFCAYVDSSCGGVTTSECAQLFLNISTTTGPPTLTTSSPTLPPSGYDPIITEVYQTDTTNQLALNVSQSTASTPVYISIDMTLCLFPITCVSIPGDTASDDNLPMPALTDVLASPFDGILTITSSAAPPLQANISALVNGTLFQMQYWSNASGIIGPWLGSAYACYNGGIGGVNTVPFVYYSFNYPNVVNFESCYNDYGQPNPTWSYVNCDWCNYLVYYCDSFGVNTTYDQACITAYYQPYPTISAIFQDFIPGNIVIDVHTSTSGQSIVYVSAQLQLFNWDGTNVVNFGAFYAEEASLAAPPLPLLSTVLAVPLSASLNFQTNVTDLFFGTSPNRTLAVFTYYADSGGLDIVGGAIACNDGKMGTAFNYYSYTNAVSYVWFQENYVTCTADTDIVNAGLAFDCAFFAYGALNCALQGLSNAACVAAFTA